MFKLIKELSDQFKKGLKDELLDTADKKHKEAKKKKKVATTKKSTSLELFMGV